ncbi:tetratricopeptide repeat protein [Amycolatopsis sp. WAC 01375]|uniref:AfsR/SARP family transcriptional regulator n=1 Tax=Amycolatopsis sp. WAC 01375 TaxID=2203194 RepID=UPI0013153D0D|nr:tetratricopeptide repeat protein [Amycolatopsis sp. WAC 01375]
MADRGADAVEFQVLGPVRVRGAGRAHALSGRLQSILLGVLLVRANQPVPVDTLTGALWGDKPDPRSEQRLQLHVHRLRGVLAEPDRLSFGAAGYRLRVLPGELDSERFASLFEEARTIADEEPQRAVELLREALGLWHADPFRDVEVPLLADWAQGLVELRSVALETLYQAELACGLNAAIIGELTELVRRYPVRERLHGLLMSALYRAGRRADALDAYRAARDTLVEELGVEPGPELRELHRRLLAGERLGPAEKTSSAPAQLPMDVREFVGRDAELAELDGLLLAGEAAVISVVAGTAGVGKTALAVRWGHRTRERFPDGQLYVDLRGYGSDQPVSPEDALGGFLRALDLDGAAIPQDLAERAARFRTLVARRRMLIVLDNARTVEQLRPLLPGSPSCFVVVTSRDALAGLVAREGARRLDLDRLSSEDARGLLRELLGDRVAAEPAAARELVERCARLPLALRITAELIRSRPARGLGEFVDELAGRQSPLDLLDVDGDPQTAVRAVFSWSYRRLDASVARMFRLLGLHPGHDTDDRAAAALAGTGVWETRRMLDVLRRAHLVDQPSDGRYQPHDLLRAYAAELAEATDSADEREAALSRLLDHYVSTASAAMDVVAPDDYAQRPKASEFPGEAPLFSTYDHAWRWLDAERANLLEAGRHGGPASVIHVSETVWRYLDTGGYYDDAAALHGRALDAARDLGSERAEANARRVLGVTMSRLGRDREAIDHLEWALAAFQRVGDQEFQAATLSFLGCVYGKRGELEEARRRFERALVLTERGGSGYLHCAVRINHSRNLLSLGRAEEARHHLDAVFALREDDRDKYIECNAVNLLARVFVHLGQNEAAFEHARRCLALAREAGFRTQEADSLGFLGVVYRRRGDLERALRHHEEAVALARAVGDTELIAEALNALGTTHAAAGRSAEALHRHGEALAVATEAGHGEQLAHANAGIGDVHAELGEHDHARRHWLQVLAFYRDLDVPQAAETRTKLGKLGLG